MGGLLPAVCIVGDSSPTPYHKPCTVDSGNIMSAHATPLMSLSGCRVVLWPSMARQGQKKLSIKASTPGHLYIVIEPGYSTCNIKQQNGFQL